MKNELASMTPARIGVGRAGSRPLTSTMLKFRYDHAAAVDSVYGEVDQSILEELQLFTVHTQADVDKETYLLRPDYGRLLSDEDRQTITQKCVAQPTIQIMVSNGLSAEAVNANVIEVYKQLRMLLEKEKLQVGTPFYVEQGRVSLMDEVGELLQPDIVIYLIGERPGLVTAQSMSAYMCYKPRKTTIESDKNVISNIHQGGIPPKLAAAQIVTLAKKMLAYEASGIPLVEKVAKSASL